MFLVCFTPSPVSHVPIVDIFHVISQILFLFFFSSLTGNMVVQRNSRLHSGGCTWIFLIQYVNTGWYFCCLWLKTSCLFHCTNDVRRAVDAYWTATGKTLQTLSQILGWQAFTVCRHHQHQHHPLVHLVFDRADHICSDLHLNSSFVHILLSLFSFLVMCCHCIIKGKVWFTMLQYDSKGFSHIHVILITQFFCYVSNDLSDLSVLLFKRLRVFINNHSLYLHPGINHTHNLCLLILSGVFMVNGSLCFCFSVQIPTTTFYSSVPGMERRLTTGFLNLTSTYSTSTLMLNTLAKCRSALKHMSINHKMHRNLHHST